MLMGLPVTNFVITILTIYSLFSDDLRLIYMPMTDDFIFTTMSIICMVLFALELIMSSIAHKNYFRSFFFWIDLVSTVSMLLDI